MLFWPCTNYRPIMSKSKQRLMLTCYFHEVIEKPPPVACGRQRKHNNDDTVTLFSVNRFFFFFLILSFFFYGSGERADFSVFILSSTYLNNQPCDQAILGIIEHRSTDRKQIQVKDMAQSHTDMELYKLNVSQLL